MLRSRYIPTVEDPLRVRELAAIGLSDDDIAAQLRLRAPKLQKIFKLELKIGASEGREQVLRQLYNTAISGKNVTASIFWVKARCGWRDTGPVQSAPKVIRHLTVFKLEDGPSKPQPQGADAATDQPGTKPRTRLR